MLKKNCSIETNNKLFDRNFNYDTSSASFNENILRDRAFNTSIDKYKNDEQGNRFIDTVEQWNNVNKLSLTDDRQINTNINTNINLASASKNLSDRIFNINPNMNKISTEDFFRDVNKKNFDTRKTGDKISNPNNKIKHFVEPNNDLSMKMLTFYQYILKKSFVCSSYSLLAVLSLFYIGTTRKTKVELEKCLGISERNNLYNGLSQVNKVLQKTKHVGVENCVIVDNRIRLLKNYKTLVQKIGLVESVNASNPQPIINKINMLVSKNTNGLIKNVLGPNLINVNTKIVLANIIYFKSNWKTKFEKKNTVEKEFYDLVETKKVKMMHLFNESLPYYEDMKYQLLELPCKDNQFCMGIMLEKNLNQIMIPPKSQTLYNHISKLKLEKVNVQLPKFTHESTLHPTDILKTVGIYKIFSNADVDDMVENKTKPIYIDKIIQKAKIIVDETGTKVMAGTNSCSSNEQIKNFFANHPFTYYIRHVPTNIIIFTGCFML